MFKRWAWRLLRPIVEAKVIAWVGRIRERWKFTPEWADQAVRDIMEDFDRIGR